MLEKTSIVCISKPRTATTFNLIYADHYAMRGEPGNHNGPTDCRPLHPQLLNALSQALIFM
ncbi:hypothetical protein ACLK19_27810 [Escherichia coli]